MCYQNSKTMEVIQTKAYNENLHRFIGNLIEFTQF